jgi:hypothetical protein
MHFSSHGLWTLIVFIGVCNAYTPASTAKTDALAAQGLANLMKGLGPPGPPGPIRPIRPIRRGRRRDAMPPTGPAVNLGITPGVTPPAAGNPCNLANASVRKEWQVINRLNAYDVISNNIQEYTFKFRTDCIFECCSLLAIQARSYGSEGCSGCENSV